MNDHTCAVPECVKPLRSSGAEWCAMHYHRWYRHGSVNKVSAKADLTVSKGRRYKHKHRPDHPLAFKGGLVYEHRMVLFDAIGYGPHACHWCGTEVDWKPKGEEGELHPDHLNGYGDDNRLENLVPACRRCNTTRGAQARSDALRAAGWWSRNDTVAVTQPRVARVA